MLSFGRPAAFFADTRQFCELSSNLSHVRPVRTHTSRDRPCLRHPAIFAAGRALPEQPPMNLLTTWAALLPAASNVLCASLPRRYAALVLAVFALCVPARAFAYKNGFAGESCGCHNGGSTPTVMITPDLT